MKKTILIDGMNCIYDKEFNVNDKLLGIINSFNNRKILVVNGFRDIGLKILEGNNFEGFSLEEEGIKKDDVRYFEKLFDKFNLKAEEVVYFDHNEVNVETAKRLGIKSILFKDEEKIKEFLQKNLDSS
jgi:HAD superfamily hydrolase (TIGR01509 family)